MKFYAILSALAAFAAIAAVGDGILPEPEVNYTGKFNIQ
jgi:hypothetical protein